jgi:hypothetical protein
MRRRTRQTARKSTGGRGLPKKTYHARDSSEEARGKRPTASETRGRPLTPPEGKACSPRPSQEHDGLPLSATSVDTVSVQGQYGDYTNAY